MSWAVVWAIAIALSILFWRKPFSFIGVLLNVHTRPPIPANDLISTCHDDPSVFRAENIIPLLDVDWESTEVPRLRPFKPKYHLTMGLTNVPMSEYIKLDKTNPDRLTLRKNIVASHPDIAIQAAPEARQAVRELYSWLTSTYLPRRFPTTFQISPCLTQLTNLAANPSSQLIPLTPPTEPREMLKILGENIDQDFLILLKDEKTCQYKLQAYVTCFPSGFNTKEKFGMKLSEIHGPVPRYGEKLEKSMDRFFDRIEVGKLVGRVNWAITTTSELFTPSGTHLYDGQDPKDEADFDIKDVHLRVENQTLHRLPETKALVFSFKTYLYPLKDVKEEENGKVAEDLAQAIEGLRAGSVPEMWHYKRGVVWGERVCEYLRS